jgi:hypothetical protein
MQFSKSIVAAAALLALAPLTQAQVKTDGLLEFYGRAELSVDQLDDGNKYSRTNLSSNASRLGFKGSKKIGGLTGIWQIAGDHWQDRLRCREPVGWLEFWRLQAMGRRQQGQLGQGQGLLLCLRFQVPSWCRRFAPPDHKQPLPSMR